MDIFDNDLAGGQSSAEDGLTPEKSA